MIKKQDLQPLRLPDVYAYSEKLEFTQQNVLDKMLNCPFLSYFVRGINKNAGSHSDYQGRHYCYTLLMQLTGGLLETGMTRISCAHKKLAKDPDSPDQQEEVTETNSQFRKKVESFAARDLGNGAEESVPLTDPREEATDLFNRLSQGDYDSSEEVAALLLRYIHLEFSSSTHVRLEKVFVDDTKQTLCIRWKYWKQLNFSRLSVDDMRICRAYLVEEGVKSSPLLECILLHGKAVAQACDWKLEFKSGKFFPRGSD